MVKPTTKFFVNKDGEWISRRRIMWRMKTRLQEDSFNALERQANKVREFLLRYRLDERNFSNTIRKMLERVQNAEIFDQDGNETDDETIRKIVDKDHNTHERMPTHLGLGDESVWELPMDVDDSDDDATGKYISLNSQRNRPTNTFYFLLANQYENAPRCGWPYKSVGLLHGCCTRRIGGIRAPPCYE